VGKRPTDEELAQSQLFNNNRQSDDSDTSRTGPTGALSQSLGLQLSPMTPRYAQQLGVSPDAGGLVILDIDGGSDAGLKGLQPGDIVVSANYKPVDTVAELEAIVANAKTNGSVLLRIQRRGQPLQYVPIRLR
jgi:serine protease Do